MDSGGSTLALIWIELDRLFATEKSYEKNERDVSQLIENCPLYFTPLV